ncbi:hypothetical protein NIES4071_23280 [Calothrix sp. NIES-4071]|nr:hypothetical protein NIES4071_23280 [Calothrix sp. NIES-4071]BAZ56653.1 hypothetical protein NIES4105_23230 [Calothrix sp. NIES-4105]
MIHFILVHLYFYFTYLYTCIEKSLTLIIDFYNAILNYQLMISMNVVIEAISD